MQYSWSADELYERYNFRDGLRSFHYQFGKKHLQQHSQRSNLRFCSIYLCSNHDGNYGVMLPMHPMVGSFTLMMIGSIMGHIISELLLLCLQKGS